MSVLEELTREHRLFIEQVRRLERALLLPEDDVRVELERVLLVLFSGLERHEELENLAFTGGVRRWGRKAAAVLSLLEGQHQAVAELRRDLLLVLQECDRSAFDQLASLVVVLARTLRRHMRMEESRLWPLVGPVEARLGPAARRRLARKLAVHSRVFAREMQLRGEMAEEMVGVGRR